MTLTVLYIGLGIAILGEYILFRFPRWEILGLITVILGMIVVVASAYNLGLPQ